MGVGTFVPEVWSPALLTSLKKAEVFAAVCNRDYEGEINQAGDTVHINSVSRPTINTYTTYQTITVEQLTTADRVLTIDQAKYFAFGVDDVDKRQAAGTFLEGGILEAAYAMADDIDKYIAGLYTNVQTANKVNAGTAVSVTTGDIAYTQITQLKRKADEANIPTQGRWLIVPPWYHALLLDTTKFNANPAGGAPAIGAVVESALLNGFVGRAAGFDIFMSNNAVNITGVQYACLGGYRESISVAEQINQVEAYRLQTGFQDAVRGLHLYGAKVVRPDGLVFLNASQT